MSVELISEKQVKTRRRHTCFACGRLSPVHSEMYSQTNRCEGAIHTVYTCTTCKQLFEKIGYMLYNEIEDCYPNNCVHDFIREFYFTTPEELLFILI